MKPFVRNSVALAFAGALAASAATPILAADLAERSFETRPVAANGYYGPSDYRSSFASEQSYVREPNYNYQPNYAYEPRRTYVVPEAQVEYRPSRCWVSTDGDRRFGYWGYCASSGATLDTR